MNAPRISAEVIDYTIGNRRILKMAYVDAVPGAITALVGVSGSGKTTLFEFMVGRRRADGQVRLDGAFVPRPSFGALARQGVFYLPDCTWLAAPLPVSWHLSAASGRSGTDWRAVAAEMGIEHVLDQKVMALSGGETRLVELTLALVLDRRVLIADEPFLGLDPKRRDVVSRHFRAMADRGVAVLFADHDVSSIRSTADRLFAMENGTSRLVKDFQREATAAWYQEWPAH